MCITYDGMHRALTTTVSSGSYASVTQQVHYVYDAATVNSTTMQNVKGTLAEAWTCTGSCSSKATDMGFSYFPESGSTGRLVAQVYEMTPHSSPHYYLTQDIDYPNGAVGNLTASLNGSSISVPSVNFGLDGEGRLYSATDTTNSLTLTSSASYNAASSPTGITLGNSDSDAFQYDSNTFRPTQFKYSITGSGAFTITGYLTWNANWSLQQMAVTDTNDSSKNQTCTYSADDLQRIASVNCSSAWAQTFSYDAFGNIAKSGSSSYAAGYSYLTNRVSSGVTASYDSNGDQTQNTWASFAWNALGQPVTVNGISATYDGLGRMVETVNGSTYTEYIYRPSGDKLAILNGSTLLKGTIPLPGGATAVYNSSGINYFRHKDWLGSSRLGTTWSHGIYSKEAYAPFGEPYYEAGTQDRSFTGEDQDTTSGIYDFMFRRYDSAAGRWLSPDPAGWGAVDLSTPQSLDRYAYVRNNPLSLTDALGLDADCVSGDDNQADSGDDECGSSDNNGDNGDDPGLIPGSQRGDYPQSDCDGPNDPTCQPPPPPPDDGCDPSDPVCAASIAGFLAANSQQQPSLASAPNNCVSPGVCKSTIDNLNPMERGKTSYRDSLPFCSTHTTVDNSTGATNSHVDLFNPGASAPTMNGNIPLLPFHLVFDALPDAIYRVTGSYLLPAGRELCQ